MWLCGEKKIIKKLNSEKFGKFKELKKELGTVPTIAGICVLFPIFVAFKIVKNLAYLYVGLSILKYLNLMP